MCGWERRWGSGAKAERSGFVWGWELWWRGNPRVANIWARFRSWRSFLWAFWWPPRACELANSLQQYWHSYLRDSDPDPDPGLGSGDRFWSDVVSSMFIPKSFKEDVSVAIYASFIYICMYKEREVERNTDLKSLLENEKMRFKTSNEINPEFACAYIYN